MNLRPIEKPYWELTDFIDENEHNLFDSVTSEFNDITGFPIDYYIKVNTENSDYLYGEDQIEEFSTPPYKTKMIYEPTSEPYMVDMFGMSSDDTLEYGMITKTIFERDVSDTLQPKIGDVIHTLWNDRLYEIVKVGSEQKIFQGMKMIWEFVLRPYKYSSESESAEDVLFSTPESDEFPDINKVDVLESEPLSAYGDNEEIENDSYDDPDSAIYGFK